MNYIVDFYKSLDTLNLIIFWGVIIVIFLLLIFSILIANKNKKLNQIINSKQKEENEKEKKFEDLPIKKEETKEDLTKQISQNETKEIIKPIEEEKKFIAEEHVMEYNKDMFSLTGIKKTNEQSEEKKYKEEQSTPKKITTPSGPYQRNVLREMSLSQTSPIGIVKQENKQEKEIDKAKELQTILKEDKLNNDITEKISKENQAKVLKNNEIKPIIEKNEELDKYPKIKKEQEQIYINKPIKEFKKEKEILPLEKETYKVETYLEKVTPIIPDNQKIPQEKTEKEKYLEEVSKKLSESVEPDNIDRTEYELKQEEEAIISYEELMQKKDSIKIIDEEEAVISIEELIKRKEKEEKLYNLTEEEENEKFIKELKNFRSDL